MNVFQINSVIGYFESKVANQAPYFTVLLQKFIGTFFCQPFDLQGVVCRVCEMVCMSWNSLREVLVHCFICLMNTKCFWGISLILGSFLIDFKGLQPLCCHEKWVFLCLTKNNCAFFTEILFLQLRCLDKSKFQLLGWIAMKFYPVLTQKQFLHSTFWWKNGCYTSLFDSQGTNVLIVSRGGEF